MISNFQIIYQNICVNNANTLEKNRMIGSCLTDFSNVKKISRQNDASFQSVLRLTSMQIVSEFL